jgi:mannan endo-1,4-beta-mannosidase
LENNADGAFQLNIFTGSDIHHPNKKIPSVLPWIIVSKESPYFITDQDKDWHPIGQNDAINWLDLAGLFRRRNLASVESYLRMLSDNGVTCMRLMLEYCQAEHHYFERPAGYFQPNMIRLWDDLFALCEKYRLRILLTPYDTYWMWIRWCQHPYNKKNGGLCNKRSHWLLCPEMRNLIKNRLAFASERWGGSGALFAWDLWNEIHAKHALHSVEALYEFVEDIGGFLRKKEIQIHGRAHLQTVSIFGPDINKQELVTECIFRHRALDFANIHIYEKGAIDNPKNTMDVAISAGRILRECIDEIKDNRPFFDSEH